MFDVRRFRHRCGNIDHRAERIDSCGTNFVRVVDAILQAHDRRGGRKQRRERTRRRFGVRRFYTKKNDVRSAHAFEFGRSFHAHRFLELQRFQQQTIFRSSVDKRGAANHHNGRTGASEHPAKVTADSARAHDGDARPISR